MTTKEPWSKFFWADWRSDPRLRACCLAARGLWMDLLAIMFEAVPRGYLVVNGHAPTDKQIAAMAGATVGEVKKLMRELLEAGVPSIADDGRWFNRRMVRDEHRKTVNRENGSKGGNPALLDKRLLRGRITEPDNRGIWGPDNHSDKSRARAIAIATQMLEEGSKEEEPRRASLSVAEAPAAFAVVSDFEARRMRHWPTESRLPAPGLTLQAQAEEFLAMGGTAGLIAEVLERGMAKAAGLGKPAPSSLMAYRNSLTEAIINHGQSAATNGAAKPKSRNPRVGSREDILQQLDMGLMSQDQADEELAALARVSGERVRD